MRRWARAAALQLAVLRTRLDVPDPYGRVPDTGGGEVPAVGAEGRVHRRTLVAEHDTQLLTGAGVPQPHGSVLVGRGEEPVVGAERDRGDGLGIRPDRPRRQRDLCTGRRVPEAHRAARSPGGGEPRPVAGQSEVPAGRDGVDDPGRAHGPMERFFGLADDRAVLGAGRLDGLEREQDAALGIHVEVGDRRCASSRALATATWSPSRFVWPSEKMLSAPVSSSPTARAATVTRRRRRRRRRSEVCAARLAARNARSTGLVAAPSRSAHAAASESCTPR
jgi:hypothetical protein